MIEIRKIESKYAGCVSCHNHDEKPMYSIRFSPTDYCGLVIDLCEECMAMLNNKIIEAMYPQIDKEDYRTNWWLQSLQQPTTGHMLAICEGCPHASDHYSVYNPYCTTCLAATIAKSSNIEDTSEHEEE